MRVCMLLLTLLIVFVFTSCEYRPGGWGPGSGPEDNEGEFFDPKDDIRDDDWWDGDKTGGNHFAIPAALREYLKSLFSSSKLVAEVELVKGNVVVWSCYVSDELDIPDFLDDNLSGGLYELRVYRDGNVEICSFVIE